MLALLAILVTGVRYGFKIIERSSKGFLRPSDYPLTDDDLVSEYLPYKYAAMTLVFGVLATLLELMSGGNEFIAHRCLAVLLRGDHSCCDDASGNHGQPAWRAESDRDDCADPAHRQTLRRACRVHLRRRAVPQLWVGGIGRRAVGLASPV